MGPLRLAVLGIGSVRCAPPIIGALAGYFGERELEVRLYDEDGERLDLFDRLARRCFDAEECHHRIVATTDPFEALEGADLVILAIGENSARKFLRRQRVEVPAPPEAESPVDRSRSMPRSEAIEAALGSIMRAIPDGAPVLSLMRDVSLEANSDLTPSDWLAPLNAEERLATPYQVLRWIRHEEPVGRLADLHRRSPIKVWLDTHGSR